MGQRCCAGKRTRKLKLEVSALAAAPRIWSIRARLFPAPTHEPQQALAKSSITGSSLHTGEG
jgi:hypothetical protein